MWPLRVYTRRKRAGQRLNLTPALEGARPGPGLGAGVRGPGAMAGRRGRGPGAMAGRRGRGAARGLPRVAEGPERSRRGGRGPGLPSTLLRVTGGKSLQENSTREETQNENMAPLSELVNDDLQVDSSSSNSELVSGLSLPCDVSSSLLSCSTSESFTEDKSIEEELSSFPSPELFRGSDYLDWERPELEDHVHCRNSTLLDTSKAVAIDEMPPFPNLSVIVGTTSENYQKCHTKVVMTLADQNISPKPKHTSNSESDNAACEVLLAEKTCPSTPKNTKRKPEKDPEDRDTSVQRKLTSPHLQPKVLSSPCGAVPESRAGQSAERALLPKPLEPALPEKDPEDRDTSVQRKLTSPHLQPKVLSSPCGAVPESRAGQSAERALLPKPLEPALKTHSRISGKKSRGLFTSTPSSETGDFAIDLSSVQKSSFEDIFPNVSNYVNSNEIVPVSSLQENPSNEFPSNTSEICYIIRASPGTRQMKNKAVTVNKKRYSPPKDITEDIIIKTNYRM